MSNSCCEVLQTTANLELWKTDHWLRPNKLCLNYNVTNFVVLNSQEYMPTSFEVIANNHNISTKEKLKHLGVLLDNNGITWKHHAKKVKSHVSRYCGPLSKLKNYLTQSVLKVINSKFILALLIIYFHLGRCFRCNHSTFH